MKKIHITWLISVAGFWLLVAGCGLIEPEDSQIKSNQPPETVITSGPRANDTTSYFVRIAWKGEDQDGQVKGFNLVVNGQRAFVTRTDSTFAFSTANQTTPYTISVAAVDDRGDADPTPATLTFTATNVAPNTSLTIAGNPAQGATFGRGGIFTIVAADPDNGPEFSYRYNIDNGPWSAWRSNPAIEFSLSSADGLLPVGQHTFFAQVRDQALGVDETPAQFRFVVSTDVKPGVSLSPQYNSAAFYEDNSAFAFPTRDSVVFSWAPTFGYAGAMSTGSRYRVDGGALTEYSTTVSTLKLIDVAPGTHTFEVQFRDLGGVESDIKNSTFNIVAPTFGEGVLVIDDGNGNRVDPNQTTGDTKADGFYTETLTAVGAKFKLYDINAQGNPTPARGIGRYSTVIWQSDESFLTILQQQTKVVREYLTLGGKFWLAGWKPLQQIAGASPVESFRPSPTLPESYQFIWDFFKLASTRQATVAAFIGAAGQAGHPNLNVDATRTRLPMGRLTPIDVFTVRSDVPQATPIYKFVARDSASSAATFHGQFTGMKYLGNDFKVVVFGFPFYPMKTVESTEAARMILKDFGEIP